MEDYKLAGRPPKKGIDFAGWSVDIFDNDTKIDKLLDARGWEGFGVYFYLCQRAYGGEGYFYQWSYDDSASTARKMGCGISAGTVRETVGYCLHIGLFDKGLFDRHGILTSRGIQKRYCMAIKDRDIKEVVSEYWLLHKNEECKGLIKLPLNTNLSEVNTNFSAENSNYDRGNANSLAQNKSKVKESKVNKSKGKVNICAEPDIPAPTSSIKIPLNDKSFYDVPLQRISEWKDVFPAVNVEEQLKRMVVWCNANPTKKKTRRGVERFITNWLSREQDRGARYCGSVSDKNRLEEWANG